MRGEMESGKDEDDSVRDGMRNALRSTCNPVSPAEHWGSRCEESIPLVFATGGPRGSASSFDSAARSFLLVVLRARSFRGIKRALVSSSRTKLPEGCLEGGRISYDGRSIDLFVSALT